jgi:hypothetical protein
MRRRRWLALAAASLAIEAAVLYKRTGKVAGRVEVRCRSGHRFTTLWIPGVSLTSLRLGPWRVQRCPVGKHWSIVTPV